MRDCACARESSLGVTADRRVAADTCWGDSSSGFHLLFFCEGGAARVKGGDSDDKNLVCVFL